MLKHQSIEMMSVYDSWPLAFLYLEFEIMNRTN